MSKHDTCIFIVGRDFVNIRLKKEGSSRLTVPEQEHEAGEDCEPDNQQLIHLLERLLLHLCFQGLQEQKVH
jgi:hypothetical protein